jgi:hypothetical protein
VTATLRRSRRSAHSEHPRRGEHVANLRRHDEQHCNILA